MAASLSCLSLFLLLSFTIADSTISSNSKLNIGINYGRIANNLPSPTEAVALIKALKIGKVKLYDSAPTVLQALANTGLEVVISLPNEDISTIATSKAASDEWVQHNVVAHVPATQITTIVAGNELLTYTTMQQTWSQLVPAMKNIYGSLKKTNLSHSIKVTSSLALNCLSISYPPSSGAFRDDIATSIIQPMLRFLSQTGSFFFVNVYPYFAWAANTQVISLNYALFSSSLAGVQDGELHYTNLLDAQLDAILAAMAKLGYPNVKLAISETGWPSHGDANEIGATIQNAASYNRGLVRKMLANPPMGTPRRPRTFISTYLFSLFNEDEKPGPATERNWGILYSNGSLIYAIDLTGRLRDEDYEPLSSPKALPVSINRKPSHSLPHVSAASSVDKQWCIASPSAQASSLQTALDYACGQGEEICMAIQPNQACFQPNSLISHASYAFNKYWQSVKHAGGTCDFEGAAILTHQDPSQASCSYPYYP